MQTAITATYGSRIAGGLAKRPALGTTIQHTVYVGSSVFLILIMPLSGFLIESDISINWYFQIVIYSMILSSLLSLLVVLRLNLFQKYFQKVFYFYSNSYIPGALFKASSFKKIDFELIEMDTNFSINKVSIKKCFASFIAYSFVTSCYFVVFLLSIEYSDYRLTISQFSIVLQGFGTFLISFYIDPMLSRSIDNIVAGSNEWVVNIFSVLLGRVIALAFMGCFFWLFYLFKV